jgi:hypothetical protein
MGGKGNRDFILGGLTYFFQLFSRNPKSKTSVPHHSSGAERCRGRSPRKKTITFAISISIKSHNQISRNNLENKGTL